jgi:hypothetical protein
MRWLRGKPPVPAINPQLADSHRVMVPPFIESGTMVVVNTATGEYMKRAEQWRFL